MRKSNTGNPMSNNTVPATITNINLGDIHPGNNDRKHFDIPALRDLAANIAEHGLAQPITVRPHPTLPNAYQIVAGERRYRAHQINGTPTIAAIIRQLDDEQASAIMLVENTSRADLNPIEEANAYEERANQFSWSNAKIANVAGVSETRVRNRRKLLTLQHAIQEMVATGNLPIGQAELLTRLDMNRQLIALRVLVAGKPLTTKQFAKMVGELEAEQNQSQLIDLSTLWIELSQQQDDVAIRGRNAVVNVPTADNLPIVSAKNTTSETIAAYIADLTNTGNESAAAAIGTLYTALVKMNFMGAA